MVEYLYKAKIWKDCSNVIGVDPTQEALNKTDFETNYKSSTVQITDITLAETTFISEKTYLEFKALITGDISWTDVKCQNGGCYYQLYLLTANPL